MQSLKAEGVKISEKEHLFSRRDLKKLLVPVIVEQLLTSLMGTADTMMVSHVMRTGIMHNTFSLCPMLTKYTHKKSMSQISVPQQGL